MFELDGIADFLVQDISVALFGKISFPEIQVMPAKRIRAVLPQPGKLQGLLADVSGMDEELSCGQFHVKKNHGDGKRLFSGSAWEAKYANLLSRPFVQDKSPKIILQRDNRYSVTKKGRFRDDHRLDQFFQFCRRFVEFPDVIVNAGSPGHFYMLQNGLFN